MNDETPSSYDSDSTSELTRRVARLAAVLASQAVSGSDRAALKRHSPGNPPPLSFFRVWLFQLGDELPSDGQMSSWALIAWGLAYSGGSSHRPGHSLGRAMAEAGYSEARLERLLDIRDDVGRERLLAAAIRFLAAKGASFDWVHIASFLLLRDGERREAFHRRMATDFYRQWSRSHQE